VVLVRKCLWWQTQVGVDSCVVNVSWGTRLWLLPLRGVLKRVLVVVFLYYGLLDCHGLREDFYHATSFLLLSLSLSLSLSLPSSLPPSLPPSIASKRFLGERKCTLCDAARTVTTKTRRRRGLFKAKARGKEGELEIFVFSDIIE
jgi:hypothetical protein